MIKYFIFGLLTSTLGACAEGVINEGFMADVAAVDPNGPQTEVIYQRFPAIEPDKVEVRFGYSFECENLEDVGVLIGWGDNSQEYSEIIKGFQVRAAKYGANLVVDEVGASSLEEMNEILHRRTEYTMMRCR